MARKRAVSIVSMVIAVTILCVLGAFGGHFADASNKWHRAGSVISGPSLKDYMRVDVLLWIVLVIAASVASLRVRLLTCFAALAFGFFVWAVLAADNGVNIRGWVRRALGLGFDMLIVPLGASAWRRAASEWRDS